MPTPEPASGKCYALDRPYNAVMVTSVDSRWVHIDLDPRVAARGVPTRIRLRHWANKHPVELTPEMLEELMDKATRIRKANEDGVPFPVMMRGGGLGVRGEQLLESVEAVAWLCPDGGSCHHNCGAGEGARCWRADNAGPLSGVFVDDEWPEGIATLRARVRPDG